MKYLLSIILSAVLVTPVFAGGEFKEVCRDKKDKAGKSFKECKKIKVHKKLEGTKVPGQK